MICPRCGTQNPDNQSMCYRCGLVLSQPTYDSRQAQWGEGKMTCPSCGRTVSSAADVCHGCGYNFRRGSPRGREQMGGSQQQYQRSQSQQQLDQSQLSRKSCPVCSRPVTSEVTNCPSCGYTLKKKEVTPVVREAERGGEGKNCPVCSSRVTGDVCHRCGFTVKKKEEEEGEEGEAEEETEETEEVSEEEREEKGEEGEEKAAKEEEAESEEEEGAEKKEIPLGELKKVDAELEKFLADKMEALKKMKTDLSEEENKLSMKKLKIAARIRIFEDQKQKLMALLDTMEVELKAKRKSLEEEEAKLHKIRGSME